MEELFRNTSKKKLFNQFWPDRMKTLIVVEVCCPWLSLTIVSGSWLWSSCGGAKHHKLPQTWPGCGIQLCDSEEHRLVTWSIRIRNFAITLGVWPAFFFFKVSKLYWFVSNPVVTAGSFHQKVTKANLPQPHCWPPWVFTERMGDDGESCFADCDWSPEIDAVPGL